MYRMVYLRQIVFICLPSVLLSYTDDHQVHKIEVVDRERLDVSLNDDFIIPNPNLPCPDVREEDCQVDVHSIARREVLLYAKTKVTTSQSTSTIESLEIRTSPPAKEELKASCEGSDDEDCAGHSGEEPPAEKNSPKKDLTGKKIRTSKSPPLVQPPSSQPTVRTAYEPKYDSVQDGRPILFDSQPKNGLPPLHEFSSTLHPPREDGLNVYQPPARDDNRKVPQYDQQMRLTLNMNIFLIVGIAAGVVILLLILIVAVCMYNGRTAASNKSVPSKIDRYGAGAMGPPYPTGQTAGGIKTGYAYEACNTLPPGAEMQHGGVGLHQHNFTPMTVMQSGGGGTAPSAPLTPVKSNKRDVKEWYV